MVNIRHKQVRFAGLWLGSLLITVLLGRPNLWLIGLGLYVTYRLLNPYLSHRIFSSLVMRLVTIFLLYTLIIQCIIVTVWLISPDTPLGLAPLITLAFLAATYGVLRRLGVSKQGTASPSVVDRQDIVSILLVIVVSLAIIVPSMHKSGLFNAASFVQLINASVDDASHLSSVNDHIATNRGILTNADANHQLRNNTMYPASWHSLNALLITTTSPDIKVGNQTLIAFAITKVLWFVLLLYVAFMVSLQLWAGIRRKAQLSIVECVVFVLIAAYFLQMLVHTFIDGFYSFVPQVMYGVLLLAFIAQLTHKNKQDTAEPSFEETFLLLSVTALAGSLSWFLPTPALALFLGALLIGQVRGRGWMQSARSLLSSSIPFLPLYILVAVAILTQLYVLSVDQSSGAVDFFESLLVSGGVTIYTTYFYIFFGLGLGFFFWGLHRNANIRSNRLSYLYTLLFTTMLAYLSFIYVYQQAEIYTNAYYYHKLLYLTLIIALPLVIAGYAYMISLAATNAHKLLYAVLAVCLLLNFVGVEPTTTVNPPRTYLAYLQGEKDTPFYYSNIIYNHLRDVSTMERYDEKTYFFLYDPDNPRGNDASSVLLRVNKPMTACSESMRVSFLKNDKPLKSDKVAAKACNDYTIYVIVDYNDIQKLTKLGLKKIRVINHAQAGGSAPL